MSSEETQARESSRSRRAVRGIWRWTKRIVIAVAVVLLIARATIGLWLPSLANRVAAPYDLHVTWEDLDLSILGLSLDLMGLRVVPLPETELAGDERDQYLATAQPLARLDDLGLDADVSALFRGDIRVHRVEVGGLETWLSRDAEGAWNFERHLPTPAPAGSEPEEATTVEPPKIEEAADAAEEAPAADPSAIDFSSPVEISTIDLHGIRVHLNDALAKPTLDTVFDLHASIRDVGHPERPIQARITARAEHVLDALLLTAEADLGEAKLLVDLNFEVDGVGLRTLAPYLALVGIEPSASKLNARVGASVDLTPLARATGANDSEDDDVVDLGGTLTLRNVSVDADGEVAVLLLPTTVVVNRARTTAYDLESAVVSGLRAQATRLPGGTMRVAGLDFVGAPASADDEAPVDEPEDPAAAASAPPSFRLKRLALENVELTFQDEALAVPQTLLSRVSAEVRSIVLDAETPGAPLELSLNAAVEGAGSLGLTGTAVPTGDEISANLNLSGSDVTLDTVRPYLELAGLRSTLTSGTIAGDIRFRMVPGSDGDDADAATPTRIEGAVSGLEFRDGETLHAGLETLELNSMVITQDEGSTIERVGLAGATLPIELFPGGAFRGFGLETLGLDASAEGRDLGLAAAEIGLTDLAFGGAGSRATLTGSFDLMNIADDVQLDGSVVTREGPLDLDAELTLSGQNVSFEGLREILLAQGIEPDLEGGAIRLAAEVSAKASDEETTVVQARVHDIALTNRGVDVVAIDEVKVTRLETGPKGTHIDSIELSAPRVILARDDAGILLAAGLRIGVPTQGADVVDQEAAADTAELAQAPPRPGSAGDPAEDPAGDPAANPGPDGEAAAGGGGLVIDRVTLAGLSARWSDAFVSPTVETEFTAAAELVDIDLSGGDSATPLKLHLEAALEGALRSMTLDGTASLGGPSRTASATLALDGLRAGPLASYLPPSMEVTLEDGRLRATFEASAEPGQEGGQALRAAVTELDYRDGADGEALLAFQSFVFEAPRIDSEARVFEVETLATRGFAFDAERTAPDRIKVLGLALVSPPASTTEVTSDSAADGAETSEGSVPPDREKATPAPSGPAPGNDATVTLPPTVRLGTLDLGIDRLRYIDRTRADAIPLDLSLALVTPGPQVLCRPDPTDLPPLEFSAVGAISPLVEKLSLTTSLEPFAADPGASFQLSIEGITGAQLARISPEVAAEIDPSAYVDGSFEVEGDARFSYARRGPLDFSLDRGFGAIFSIEKFALKETPDAEPTGFDRLDVDVKRVSPDTGDVRISSIDLNGLRARFHQKNDGMVVAGLRLPNRPASSDTLTEEAVEEPFDGDSGGSTAESSPSAGATETEAPLDPEISIDRLTVAGLDFEFLDTTVEPTLRLPIADLQLEVQRFTTRTLVEPRPFSFRAVVDAGQVELEERSGADNLLFGVLGSAADVVTGKDDKFETESRRVWDLLEASGRLSLGPELRGRVQVSLLGLELPAFRGPALAAGVKIGDGLLDNRTALRFREDGGLSLDTKTTASYLSLSEPPGGPITQYLQLPAPLDTVLYLLRNDSGEQVIPIRLDIPADGVSATRVASLAATTLGTLITDAVSSAPMRVLGPLQNVAGALGLTREPLTAETVTLQFAEGAATMAAAAVERTEDESERNEQLVTNADPLGNVVRALKGNPDLRVVVQAELGEGDLDVARRLGNPPRESIESLIEYNRRRKASLERERSQLAARARAQVFAGAAGMSSDRVAGGLNAGTSPSESRSEVLARLQSLDSERAAVEKALDDLFSYIRPGAERRADMRTRNAALALANQRLDRVRLALVGRVGDAVARRIDVRRARFRKSTEKNPLPPLGLVTVTPK
ncbi:hypothetical protein Poly30_23200 [Planctomycetes bacterium Poly30]|uniref:AsmA family protein n=1 Tax=Saltatorellus ferox TaxID=2528018 RepID=A0A518ERX5_9BACT|nr:hypothetical protein Poly30_23200 [Planctomycetes bacterium Poly30]